MCTRYYYVFPPKKIKKALKRDNRNHARERIAEKKTSRGKKDPAQTKKTLLC